VHGKSNLDI